MAMYIPGNYPGAYNSFGARVAIGLQVRRLSPAEFVESGLTSVRSPIAPNRGVEARTVQSLARVAEAANQDRWATRITSLLRFKTRIDDNHVAGVPCSVGGEEFAPNSEKATDL